MQKQILLQESVPVYRVENPLVLACPNGVTSHKDLIGQWFSPNLKTATGYLRKTTTTQGPGAEIIYGSRLVIAQIPKYKLDSLHVSRHPVAALMDVENDNYIVPRDGSFSMQEIPLDVILDGLHGKLGNIKNMIEAKQRVAAHIGATLFSNPDLQK